MNGETDSLSFEACRGLVQRVEDVIPRSQETRRATPRVSFTPSGGWPGSARPWGRSGDPTRRD